MSRQPAHRCDSSVAPSSAWEGSHGSKTDMTLVTSALPAFLNSWLVILESRGARCFALLWKH